jgi:flagellar FliL protein
MAKRPKKSEAEGAEDEPDDRPKRDGKLAFLRNKYVLAGLAVLVLAGGGFGVMASGVLGRHGEDKTAETAEAAPTPEKKSISFVDLPEMTVNLDSGDRAQYLKVKIALEVSEAKLAADIQPMMPRVLDTFQTFMRELRPADLEGSAGLFRLKEELTKRVNVAVFPAKVDAVLFKEIVVQ